LNSFGVSLFCEFLFCELEAFALLHLPTNESSQITS
jgi:hypothetical protein